MPEVTSYEPGTFCWVELATTDPKKAKSFYASLFAWSPIGMSLTSHTRTMMSLSPTPTPHAAKAKSLGGKVVAG